VGAQRVRTILCRISGACTTKRDTGPGEDRGVRTRRERPIPLTQRAYEALEWTAPDVGLIFTAWNYRKALRAAARAVGIEGAQGPDLRDFRHAAITDGARKSGHLTGSSYMAGHTNMRTTDRYSHPQIDDARKVLNKRFPSIDTPCVSTGRKPQEGSC
jgi:integrase